MNISFTNKIFNRLFKKNLINKSNRILTVCATESEEDYFNTLGFTNVILSGLDKLKDGKTVKYYPWCYQDAQDLSYTDEQFDYVFVSAGLHHCSQPHKALLEMYRVAKKGIIVVEARDSITMRLANFFKLAYSYETQAVIGNNYTNGGVNNTGIPNFIYRWTERELKKTINSFHPIGENRFIFFYGLELPYRQKSRLKSIIVRLAAIPLILLFMIFRKQGNSFGTVILKPTIPEDLWPWLKLNQGKIEFNLDYKK